MFRRSRVQSLQRLDAVDFNRTNDSAWQNLVNALVYTLGLSPNVVWGLVASTPGGMSVQFSPGGAVSPNGPIAFNSAQTVVIPAAHPSLPRIDLVSVGYTEAQGSNEARTFWNTGSQSSYVQNTNTEIIASFALTVTPGNPAANPTPPATPSGHVPVAYVRVPAGATAIDPNNITRPPEAVRGVIYRQPAITIPMGGIVHDLNASAWESDGMPSNNFGLAIEHKLPVGRTGLLAGGVTVQPSSVNESLSATVAVALIEVGGGVLKRGGGIVPHAVVGIGAGIGYPPGWPIGASFDLVAPIVGDGATHTYRLRMGKGIMASFGGTVQTWSETIAIVDAWMALIAP
jgi:hypothetical protein